MRTFWVSRKKCMFIGLCILVASFILFLFETKIGSSLDYDDESAHIHMRSVIDSEDSENDPRADEDNPIIRDHMIPFNEDELRMTARLTHAKEVCERYSKLNNLTDMRVDGFAFEYTAKNLTYCFTPKVGCTFWKRVIRFLNHDFRGTKTSPGDISRMEVHYTRLKHTRVYNLNTSETRSLLSKGESFMFTRDPYSRLWSAYLDKYYLPDFWRDKAKITINVVRPNATLLQKKCANDITFEEFLTYVVKMGKTGESMNEHYTPVYRLCNPCLMKFDYIGKQETFVDDSKYILHDLGLDYIMENYTYDSRVAEELKTLTDYNFELKRKTDHECFDIMEVAERIWKTFQMNGYLPNHVAFPRASLLDTVRNWTKAKIVFNDLVSSTYEKYKSDAALWKEQRRAALVDNFRKVSLAILLQLEEIYKLDFLLFSYDPRPDDIFNRAKD